MSLAVRGSQFRWNSRIPFRFSSNVTSSMRDAISAAIADYERLTQARFCARDGEADFITFRRDDDVAGCGVSGIGRGGGEVVIRLKSTCGKGTALHEMGHALGLQHEMKRPDRDDFVEVHIENVESGQEHNFTKLEPANVVTHGPYDYGSIMHYDSYAFSRNGRKTIEAPQSIGQRSQLSGGDLATVRRLMPNNVHINALDGNGKIGRETTRYHWSENWTISRFFRIGFTDFLFLLKTNNGTAHIYRMEGDGTVGPRVDRHNWSSGWNTVEFFRAGLDTFLLLLKSGSGVARIYKMNGDGSVGALVETLAWSGGWTSVCFYNILFTDYMLLLKLSNGRAQVRRMNGDGSVGDIVDSYNFSGGWSSVIPFTQGLSNFLFMLKRRNGRVVVKEITSEGKLGGTVDSRDWSRGWSQALIYEKDWWTKYLFLLSSGSGAAKVRRIRGDGTMGAQVETHSWTPGWTSASIMDNRYLFILKARGLGSMI